MYETPRRTGPVKAGTRWASAPDWEPPDKLEGLRALLGLLVMVLGLAFALAAIWAAMQPPETPHVVEAP